MQASKAVFHNIQAYKRKYYKGMLVKGCLVSMLTLLLAFIVGSLLEYSFWFGTSTRAVLLLLFVFIFLFSIYKYVLKPLLYLFGKSSGISDEDAAKNIGNFYSEIGDSLLNLVQLYKNKGKNTLITASINQRSQIVTNVSFPTVIQWRKFTQLAPFLGGLLLIVVAIIILYPSVLWESSARIANFNRIYTPSQLFSFTVQNKNLTTYKNEPYDLKVFISGKAIPSEAFIVHSGRKVKMQVSESGLFGYEFTSPQHDITFRVEAAGIQSNELKLNVVPKPTLKNFTTRLTYPSYTSKGQQVLNGVGDVSVPEGTNIQWNIQTSYTDSVIINFSKSEKKLYPHFEDQNLYSASHTAYKSEKYDMSFKNKHGVNKEKLKYNINVTKDQYPSITLETYKDTVLYDFVVLHGSVSDDYGIDGLKVYYKTSQDADYQSFKLKTSREPFQEYYYKWSLDTLLNLHSDEITYYLQVWDNDAVNGSKSTKSTVQTFRLPSAKEVSKKLAKSENKAKENAIDALKEAESLKKELTKSKEKLKGKNKLSWQEENKLKDLIKKKKTITEAIEELKKQNAKNNLQKNRFTKQQQDIKKKAEQLQQLMNELLDEETKKLYEELQKLLDEQKDVSKIQEKISELDNKEKNLAKELERALELMKRMQLEQKIEETKQDVEELSQQQEKLSEETHQKKSDLAEIKEKQEKIKEQFDDIQKDISTIEEMNQELKRPESLPNFEPEISDQEQSQKEINENLNKGKRKKASEQQKKATKQMKKMAKKMSQMQGGMQMQMMQENLDHLRHIIHSLLKLSFDQESLMKSFRTIDQSDPRFVELSQSQIKLKDDAKILEDSLLSLAQRVFQISTFVTREVSSMNQYMDESSTAIREREQGQVVSKQQFAMTSMNNLALLLDDVLQQMQQQMADAMGKPQKGNSKGKKMPGMSELQKSLNNKIKQLKKSGKAGRELSEELADLAAQQEKLRRTLEKYKDDPNAKKEGKGSLGDIINKMEETEIDLVNKSITEQTIKRQEEILTRMLESEDALRNQDEEEKREAEQAFSHDQYIPKAFEEYLKAKEKEVELLRSLPPKLLPHYKREVNEYFDRSQ